MENVAKNEVKNEVKEVAVVEAVKNNIEEKKEEQTMENTNTAVTNLTFEVTRNSHDALDVKFSEKPCREILMRMNEGFTKRSERFNWFNGVWSTFRFNASKEAERDGKDNELLECKMFIEKIISEPLTMTDEEAQAKYKEARAEAKKPTKKADTKKKASTKKKSTKKADTKAKKEAKPKTDEKAKEEANALNKKINAYLKEKGMNRKDFDKMPEDMKALILIGAGIIE